MKVKDLLGKLNIGGVNGIESLMIIKSAGNTTLMHCNIRCWEGIKDDILDLEIDVFSLDMDCYKLIIYVL